MHSRKTSSWSVTPSTAPGTRAPRSAFLKLGLPHDTSRPGIESGQDQGTRTRGKHPSCVVFQCKNREIVTIGGATHREHLSVQGTAHSEPLRQNFSLVRFRATVRAGVAHHCPMTRASQHLAGAPPARGRPVRGVSGASRLPFRCSDRFAEVVSTTSRVGGPRARVLDTDPACVPAPQPRAATSALHIETPYTNLLDEMNGRIGSLLRCVGPKRVHLRGLKSLDVLGGNLSVWFTDGSTLPEIWFQSGLRSESAERQLHASGLSLVVECPACRRAAMVPSVLPCPAQK